MSAVAGVDIGNATTEVVLLDGERLLGADRLPTRGRKGSADSLRGAAALVRRIERRLAVTVGEARIAPLRAVGTATFTIPAVVPDTGRLRVLAAGVSTPGGDGHLRRAGPSGWTDPGLADRGLAGPGLAGRGTRAGQGRAGRGRTGRGRATGTPGSRWCPPGVATRRRRGGCASCSPPGSRSGRSWPAATRACSSPTASAPRSPSSTRPTWPRPPPAPCWPSRSGRPASR